jgi:TIR domain
MAQVFISHQTKYKKVALSIKKYLEQRLISSWIDVEGIQAGDSLNREIIQNIKASHYFVALISHGYVRSNYCMLELEEVQRYLLNGSSTFIPVLLEAKDSLRIDELPSDRATLLDSLLSKFRYTEYDQYNPDLCFAEIARSIAKGEKLEFAPVQKKNIGGTEVQLIQFDITAPDGKLPTDFLSKWDLPIEADLLAYNDSSAEEKLFRAGKPVALNGRGPAWLYAYLTVQFKNLCPVYVFNHPSKEYICVYDESLTASRQGSVLKDEDA